MTKYLEYLIEYDNENLCVYLSGLDEDGYWWHIECFDEINNPEDFAQGLEQAYKDTSINVSVEAVTV